jgi:hypothetical protein
MAITKLKDRLRVVSHSIDADGVVGPIDLHDYTEASYHLARSHYAEDAVVSYQLLESSFADGAVSVEVTNDPDRSHWHRIDRHTAQAVKELPRGVEAVRFILNGRTAGTHYIHVYRIER